MKITDLTIGHLKIPFNISFSHTSATRNMTDSVLIKAQTKHNIGYGESCPRSYVTNETYPSTITFFQTHKASLIASISDIATLKAWMNSYQYDIDLNPAAWCAIELAILDVLAKEETCSVENLLQIPELSGCYSYTAVLGDSSLEGFSELLSRYQKMGFTDYKVKLSGDIEHDKAKCDLIVEQDKTARIRLDANNLWHQPDEAIEYIQALQQPIFAVEEPIQVRDYEGLLAISSALDLKIILDESFVQLQQFECIQDQPNNWIINIRISKMGGVLRSIEVAKHAEQLGIDCIVGAQVGETTILTRAALSLVNSYRNIIIAQEGGCGTYLLKNDICEPVLMFTAGGRITEDQISKLTQHGFGLSMRKN